MVASALATSVSVLVAPPRVPVSLTNIVVSVAVFVEKVVVVELLVLNVVVVELVVLNVVVVEPLVPKVVVVDLLVPNVVVVDLLVPNVVVKLVLTELSRLLTLYSGMYIIVDAPVVSQLYV